MAFAIAFPQAVDHDDRGETWPVVSNGQPADIGQHMHPARLDPAVIAIDGLMHVMPAIGEAAFDLFGRKQFDVFMKRALIALSARM